METKTKSEITYENDSFEITEYYEAGDFIRAKVWDKDNYCSSISLYASDVDGLIEILNILKERTDG